MLIYAIIHKDDKDDPLGYDPVSVGCSTSSAWESASQSLGDSIKQLRKDGYIDIQINCNCTGLYPKPTFPEWVSVKHGSPSEDAIYAGKYGVSVLVYDEKEAEVSGRFEPTTATYIFKEKKFKVLAHGPKGAVWNDAFWVSHWIEKPLTPKDKKLFKELSEGFLK